MSTKFEKSKSNGWIGAGLGVLMLLAFICDCAWDSHSMGKYSWEQSSHEFTYRISEGKVSVVNPLGHPVNVIVADTSGAWHYFQKISGGSVSVPMPVCLGWSCTVWDQQPVSFIVVRKPSL